MLEQIAVSLRQGLTWGDKNKTAIDSGVVSTKPIGYDQRVTWKGMCVGATFPENPRLFQILFQILLLNYILTHVTTISSTCHIDRERIWKME